MNIIKKEFKDILQEATSTTFTLLKIMIPISIIVKVLSHFGLIEIIGGYLFPFMNYIGIPGEFGLVWATAMVTNIYGGILVFLNLSIENTYSIAQVTILATIILIAHSLPVELRISQKAGVSLWYLLLLRIFCALILGAILNFAFTFFNVFSENSTLLWNPGSSDPSLVPWVISQLKNYVFIFVIIFALLLLMKILKLSGAINKINKVLEPGLEKLGMSKAAAPLTIIGMTVGISYGGGLIINETKRGHLTAKDKFLSLSLMALSHSLIEDTLIMVAIGASLVGILFARLAFTIIIIIILIKIISKMKKERFEKYLVKT